MKVDAGIAGMPALCARRTDNRTEDSMNRCVADWCKWYRALLSLPS